MRCEIYSFSQIEFMINKIISLKIIKHNRTTSVWRYGGFGASIKQYCQFEHLEFLCTFVLKNRHIAKPKTVSGNFADHSS